MARKLSIFSERPSSRVHERNTHQDCPVFLMGDSPCGLVERLSYEKQTQLGANDNATKNLRQAEYVSEFQVSMICRCSILVTLFTS